MTNREAALNSLVHKCAPALFVLGLSNVGELQINNAFVTGHFIRTDNGVTYVIDSALMPQYR
jgi:uncharacterized surface protein with fasciclin (FAS1) repeats